MYSSKGVLRAQESSGAEAVHFEGFRALFFEALRRWLLPRFVRAGVAVASVYCVAFFLAVEAITSVFVPDCICTPV